MKRIKQILILTSGLISLLSCEREVTYDNVCGPLKTFEVDKDYCKLYDLREENFSLKYPENLTMESQEEFRSSNYVSFIKYDNDSTIIESVNIGSYYGIVESETKSKFGRLLGLTRNALLTNIVNQFREMGLDMHNVTIQNENIRGKDHFTTRGKFETTENIAGINGNYITQIVMIPSAIDHGLAVIMMAREDSEIKYFNDFETKGCLGPILQSIE